MAFKPIQPPPAVPESPEKLLLDLPRRKIPDVLPHQKDIMQLYSKTSVDEADVALQLPTGSGKTLVGLLIGEWRRRMFNERIVYLAPTKQLVNQVVEQSRVKYGLTVEGFTGSHNSYDPNSRSNYKSGTNIAVTTYSSLFNSNPFFDDADTIILDDVHASENYISAMWSVRIERLKADHVALHSALCLVLKPLVAPYYYTLLTGAVDGVSDKDWVDKLPTIEFVKISDQIIEIIDQHAQSANIIYSWQMIREHIHGCHLYISSKEILIRPLVPPASTHTAFANAKQRIYMSATLGEGGDLERLVGRPAIKRLPVSEGWDSHGVGRRFFIFPEMSLNPKETKEVRLEMMKETERSLVLAPNSDLRDEIASEIEHKLKYVVFDSEDIETTKSSFTNCSPAAAVVANRYDGIDFSGDECRLLFVEGLPKATNLQERFIMTRMGSNLIFNERIQTRVIQAIGRCTRSLEDYSAVVVSGEELTDYLADPHRQMYFHPELQAELHFGVEQSKQITADGIIENLKIFLENGSEWEKVNQQIVTIRKEMVQHVFPAMAELQQAVKYEIAYQKRIWHADYDEALKYADAVLSCLSSPELRGYRALWHYLAGSAAWLSSQKSGSPTGEARAIDEFLRAKKAANSIPWLVTLSQYSGSSVSVSDDEDKVVFEQVERLESVLSSLGTTYERKYSEREKEIIEGLVSTNTKQFENAHKLLGLMLGFESDNIETDGAPDPWWINANLCLVFEDYSGAQITTAVGVHKARQVSSHPNWIRANVPSVSEAEILPVLITAATKVNRAAQSHLQDTLLWDLNDFQLWAKSALAVIRKLRTTFTEIGDLIWREAAALELKRTGFDAVTLVKKLKQSKAIDKLVVES